MTKCSVLALLMLLASHAYADEERPEGCYGLGLLIPHRFDNGFAGTDGSKITGVATGLDICLKTKNTQPSKDEERAKSIQFGDYEIRVRKGTKTLAAYDAKAMAEDGSGSHYDFVFAATEDVLGNSGNLDEYARGRRGPIENTIFYILTNDNKSATPKKRKTGDWVGWVAIAGYQYALIMK